MRRTKPPSSRSHKSRSQQANRRLDLTAYACAAVIFLFSILLFAGNWQHDFVYDDQDIIKNNERIRSLRGLPKLFGSPYWGAVGNDGLYRPLTLTSYALNFSWSALSPSAYHVTNDIIHAVNAVLVFVLSSRLFGSTHLGLGAGLLFVVHPIHTEAVNWVVGRAELLATFFVLLACLAWMRLGIRQGGRIWKAGLAASLLSFMAILSKENGAAAFAAVVLLSYVSHPSEGDSRRQLADFLRRQWLLLVLLIGTAVCWMLLRGWAIGSQTQTISEFDNPLAAATLIQRVLTALSMIPLWFGQMILPVKFSVDYGPPVIPILTLPWDWKVWLGGSSLLGLLGASTYLLIRKSPLGFCLGLMLLGYLPTSNLIVPIGAVFAERFLYLPSVALCILMAFGLFQLAGRRAAYILLALICLGYGAQSWRRTLDWKDDTTLFAQEMQRPVPGLRSLRNYAKLMEKVDPQLSMNLYERVVSEFPSFAPGQLGFGTFLLGQKEYARALQHLEEADRLSPRNPSTLLNLGAAYANQNRWVEAVACWESVARVDPGNRIAQLNLENARRFLRGGASPSR
ncbi:MAG: tetratricopeptide repeat protein [Acidobacteriota bacterium]